MAVQVTDLWLQYLDELRYQPTDKRVRAQVDDVTVVDSVRAVLIWEPRRVVPYYAVPLADILAPLVPVPRAGDLDVFARPAGPFLEHGAFRLHTSDGDEFSVQAAAGRLLTAAAFRPRDTALAGHVILDFDAFDGWLEEDEPVIGHPQDPFHRVDVRRSSRHVRIMLGERVLAESSRPVLVFETLLPARFYLPRADVDERLLRPSPRRTRCAYKGEAAYWSVQLDAYLAEDLVWCYEQPLPGVAALAGLMCFFDERVEVEVDGQRRQRPLTHWS